MSVIWIAAAAFIGGIIAALAGWLKSEEEFNVRKFMASVVRSLVAGVGIAIAYNYSNDLSPIDFGVAWLAGAGVDVLGNRAAGAIAARRGG